MATLLSLLLAINNRPTWLVAMAWHHQGDLASWKTKPLDGNFTLLASISLASASAACLVNCCCVAAYAELAVARTLRQRASTLFVHHVHLRAHRTLLPIAQSPIRVIVVRSSTPSLTRHLSCGAWAPAKSDINCCLCNHLCSAWWCAGWNFCCHCFCNQQCWLSRSETLLALLPAMMTQMFWPMHLLQWWSQWDQFHRRHFGAPWQWWGIVINTINFMAGTLAPLQLSKVMAQLLLVARGSLLPCTAYAALRPFVARGYHHLAQHKWPIALVVRGSLSYPAQLPSLASGSFLPSLAKGSLSPSLMNAASKAFSLYSP